MNNNEILEKFQLNGDVLEIIPFGNGLINKTYKIVTSTGDKYLFQAVNGYVFHNIDDLMRNIFIVTNHLIHKGKATLEIVKTRHGRLYFNDGEMYYRVYKYIRKSISYEKIDNLDLVNKVAQGFGQLHNDLADLDPCLISETIKDFHNTPKRFDNLMDTIKEDPVGRVKECGEYISFVCTEQYYIDALIKALENEEIPERIVHNDPKINNVLFSRETNEILCVIDLDTIMPGTCLFDVGDALRSLFTGDNESNPDSSVMKVNFDVYERFVSSYLKEMNGSITKKEVELIPVSVATIALELGIRFLEDYIKGDKYFGTKFEGENLVRARGQFALAKDVIKNMDKLEEITERYSK